MRYKNLYIIGSSHIAKESANEVRKHIEEESPDIIALELDLVRARSLLRNEERGGFSFENIKRVGLAGFLFGMIGSWATKKIGKLVGSLPGTEMRAALEEASKRKIKVALIDQNIEKTLKRFSQEITWKEKFRFVWDLIVGVFFQKKELEKLGITSLDLSKVPEKKIIKKLIEHVKKRYPSIYKVLIHERNVFMAKNLNHIMEKEPEKKILAVVGAGHLEDMIKMIKKNDKTNNKTDYELNFTTG